MGVGRLDEGQVLAGGATGNAPAAIVPAVDTEWTTFTPVWKDTVGTTLSIGSGTLTGRWRRVGDTMEVQWRLQLAADSDSTANGWLLYIPEGYVVDTTKYAYVLSVGSALLRDASAGARRLASVAKQGGENAVVFYPENSTGPVTSSSPWTWTTSDSVDATAFFPIEGWTAGGAAGAPTDTEWTAYTPSWTSDSGTGVGTGGALTGYWRRDGDTMFVRIKMTLGTTPTLGTGTWRFSLPAGYLADSNKLEDFTSVGNIFIADAGASRFTGSALWDIANATFIAYSHSTSSAVNPTTPISWAAGDSIVLEAAVPIQGWSVTGPGAGGRTTVGFSGVAANPTAGGERIGALVFDGTGISTATFVAILETTNASYGAVVELYDVTGAAVVGSSTLTSTSTVPEKQSVALAVPADLASAERVYEVYLRMATANPGDTARCLAAYLEY